MVFVMGSLSQGRAGDGDQNGGDKVRLDGRLSKLKPVTRIRKRPRCALHSKAMGATQDCHASVVSIPALHGGLRG